MGNSACEGKKENFVWFVVSLVKEKVNKRSIAGEQECILCGIEQNGGNQFCVLLLLTQ